MYFQKQWSSHYLYLIMPMSNESLILRPEKKKKTVERELSPRRPFTCRTSRCHCQQKDLTFLDMRDNPVFVSASEQTRLHVQNENIISERLHSTGGWLGNEGQR